MSDVIPWITVVAAIVTVVGGGIFTIVNRRGGEKSRKTPGWGELVKENRDLRVELNDYRREVEERFDALDRKVNAFGRVLTTVVEQWPKDHPLPPLNAYDVDLLIDTLPARLHPKEWTAS